MGIFQRLFSPEYRRALAAEAAGDYLTAARSYALCGEPGKVADMHLAQARGEQDLDARIRSLRNALAFVDDTDARRAMVHRLLARALQRRAGQRGRSTDDGRRDLSEAAELLYSGEAWADAGDAFIELGERQRAAQAYSRGGLLDRVEDTLATEEREHSRARQVDAGLRDYELYLQGGQRDRAVAALEACVEAAEQKGDYRRLLEELRAALISNGRLALQFGATRLLILGRFPLVLGRDEEACDMVVRGPSVSRAHAQISVADGKVLLADRRSRNGTLLGGLPIASEIPLPSEATIGLGDSCELATTIVSDDPPLLRLEVAGASTAARSPSRRPPRSPSHNCSKVALR